MTTDARTCKIEGCTYTKPHVHVERDIVRDLGDCEVMRDALVGLVQAAKDGVMNQELMRSSHVWWCRRPAMKDGCSKGCEAMRAALAAAEVALRGASDA